MATGLGIAHEHDLEWLRVVSLTVPIAAVGLSAMLIKRRYQRVARTDQPGSIEREQDLHARAGAYVFALVATATALAVGALAPRIASWAILLALLIVLVIAYGINRLRVNRGARQ